MKRFFLSVLDKQIIKKSGVFSSINSFIRIHPGLSEEINSFETSILIASFSHGVRLSKELNSETLSEADVEYSNFLIDLVHETTYKYSVGGLNKLLNVQKFKTVFEFFYEFFLQDEKESMIPSTFNTRK